MNFFVDLCAGNLCGEALFWAFGACEWLILGAVVWLDEQ